MLTCPKKPEQGTKAGKFGYSGPRIIAPFSIPEGKRELYLKKFIQYVHIDICGCWEWQGRLHNGYGCLPGPDSSTKWAHRVSYALFKGPIVEQMHIDHVCRNRICVNPAHLRQVTPQENYEAVWRRKRLDEKKVKEKRGQLTLW